MACHTRHRAGRDDRVRHQSVVDADGKNVFSEKDGSPSPRFLHFLGGLQIWTPYVLHRHLYEALDAFRESAAMRDTLGDDFVTAYAAMKDQEYRHYQQRIPEWELAELMQAV